MKYLVVVDMQKDFITGSLGTKEAEAVLPKVVEKVRDFEGRVIFTRDTHTEDYLDTLEGKKLPVKHCIAGEDGWELADGLKDVAQAVDGRPEPHRGDRAVRTVYGHLRNLKRTDAKGVSSGGACQRGRGMLCRRHASEPSKRIGGNEDVPDRNQE